jgi:hypothetical protein
VRSWRIRLARRGLDLENSQLRSAPRLTLFSSILLMALVGPFMSITRYLFPESARHVALKQAGNFGHAWALYACDYSKVL